MQYQYFTKRAEQNYIRTTSGTIFSEDVQISGGQVIFQYKPGCIPLEAFGSKNQNKKLETHLNVKNKTTGKTGKDAGLL